jgi:hypothetical protein
VAANNLAQDVCDRKHLQAVGSALWWQGNGVRHDDLFDLPDRVEPIDRRPGEQAVCDHHPDPRDVLPAQLIDGSYNRATRSDLVVEEDGPLSPYAAHNANNRDGVVREPDLLGRRQRQPQGSGQLGSALCMPDIGGDDDRVAEVLLSQVIHKDRVRRQVVSWYTEEAMDLGGMESHCDDVIRSSSHQQVCHQTRCDGDTRGILLVRSGVGEVWDDGVHSACACSARHIQHEQEFHQMVAAGGRKGLDNENVLGPHTHSQMGGQVVIGEPLNRGWTEPQPHVIGQLLGQGRMSRAAEDERFVERFSVAQSSLLP